MNICKLGTILLVGLSTQALANISAPDLGSARFFGLLGGTVSNTGNSIISGNVGAITTVTGFPPGTATGIVYPSQGDATVAAAYTSFVSAFDRAASDGSTPVTQSIPDLTTDRTFLGNNVFSFASVDVATTSGINLTFDAQFNVSDIFILKVARDLTVNGPLTFTLKNGAQAANIYWIIGRTTSISFGSVPLNWEGSILSGTSFAMSANPGGSGLLAGTIDGCVYAETATTLAGATDINGCSADATVAPEPGPVGFVALGCLLCSFAVKKARRTPRLARS